MKQQNQRREGAARRAVLIEPLEERQLLSAATVNFNDVRQTMDGFGSQPGWGDKPSPPASTLQLAYSQTSGIGLRRRHSAP